MSSARETILAALGVLAQSVASAAFYRSREAAVARSEGIVIILEPEEETTELRTAASPMTLRDLTVLFTVTARGDVPDQAADPVIESLHRKVMADRTLGGLCALILERGTKWTMDVADLSATVVEVRYAVRYATSSIDLAQLT